MSKQFLIFFASLFLLINHQVVFAAPETIDDVIIERSGLFYNRQADTFDTTVTIRNTSAVTLAAPMRLVLESVSPKTLNLYNVYGRTEEGKPYVTVPLASPDFTLPPGKSASVPVRFINSGSQVAATEFSVRAERLDPSKTATLNVKAVMYPEGGGHPIEAGYVLLNGTPRAITDKDGRASVLVPIDTTEISIMKSTDISGEKGSEQVSGLVAGETRSIEVIVDDGGEFGAFSVLRLDRLQHSMLPINVPQITLRFFANEKAVIGDYVSMVILSDSVGKGIEATHLFSLRSDGSLVAKSEDFFKAMENLPNKLLGKKLLHVEILNKNGIPFGEKIAFYISNQKIQARLSAPPSNPGLPLGGVSIEVSVLNTEIKFEVESLPDGSFPLPLMTSGALSIKASTKQDGISYFGDGVAIINGNKRIDLRMLAIEDMLNNVSPIMTTPLQ